MRYENQIGPLRKMRLELTRSSPIDLGGKCFRAGTRLALGQCKQGKNLGIQRTIQGLARLFIYELNF